MNSFLQQLLLDAPIVTDGAWGTELQKFGLQIGECPDAWNITHPDLVEQVARSYITAGSRIILTNTFGANRIALERYDLADKAMEINRRGVEISKRAAENHAHIFASIGPSGKMLLTGEISEDELLGIFLEQATALKETGADAIVIETMSDVVEAKLAVRAAQETNLPVVACMVFDSGKNKDRTMMGLTPEQAALELTASGADVIGANCGQGIEGFISICNRLHAACDLPIWIKANAGLPEIVDGISVYDITPGEFSGHIPRLINAGASFIGGCCGTNAEFIREINNVIKSMSSIGGNISA